MNQLFFRAIDYHAEKQNKYWKLHLILFEELWNEKMEIIKNLTNSERFERWSNECVCVCVNQANYFHQWMEMVNKTDTQYDESKTQPGAKSHKYIRARQPKTMQRRTRWMYVCMCVITINEEANKWNETKWKEKSKSARAVWCNNDRYSSNQCRHSMELRRPYSRSTKRKSLIMPV